MWIRILCECDMQCDGMCEYAFECKCEYDRDIVTCVLKVCVCLYWKAIGKLVCSHVCCWFVSNIMCVQKLLFEVRMCSLNNLWQACVVAIVSWQAVGTHVLWKVCCSFANTCCKTYETACVHKLFLESLRKGVRYAFDFSITIVNYLLEHMCFQRLRNGSCWRN